MHPGKQLSVCAEFSTQTPPRPAEFVPQAVLDVQDSVHHSPVQSPELQSAFAEQASPTAARLLPGAPQALTGNPATAVHVQVGQATPVPGVTQSAELAQSWREPSGVDGHAVALS